MFHTHEVAGSSPAPPTNANPASSNVFRDSIPARFDFKQSSPTANLQPIEVLDDSRGDFAGLTGKLNSLSSLAPITSYEGLKCPNEDRGASRALGTSRPMLDRDRNRLIPTEVSYDWDEDRSVWDWTEHSGVLWLLAGDQPQLIDEVGPRVTQVDDDQCTLLALGIVDETHVGLHRPGKSCSFCGGVREECEDLLLASQTSGKLGETVIQCEADPSEYDDEGSRHRRKPERPKARENDDLWSCVDCRKSLLTQSQRWIGWGDPFCKDTRGLPQ